MKLIIAFALLVVAAPLLAGCSSPPPAFTTPPTDPATGAYIIHLTAENRMLPANAQVPVGATVHWVSDAVHNVHADDGSFDSPTLMKDGTFEYKFQAAGTFTYKCTLHDGMKGTIKVA